MTMAKRQRGHSRARQSCPLALSQKCRINGAVTVMRKHTTGALNKSKYLS